MNEAQISMSGYVATQPTWRETSTGRPNLTMRVAWTPRRMDRATGEWTDGNTSYVTVICWRKLAGNVAISLRVGDPVLIQGRLSVRLYEDKNGMRRTAVDIDAQSVGHDLARGVAMFQRVRPATGKTAAEHAAELAAAGEAGHEREDDDLGQDAGQAMMAALDEAGLASAGGDGADVDDMFAEEAISALVLDQEDAPASV